jgi:hypothetical protein
VSRDQLTSGGRSLPSSRRLVRLANPMVDLVEMLLKRLAGTEVELNLVATNNADLGWADPLVLRSAREDLKPSWCRFPLQLDDVGLARRVRRVDRLRRSCWLDDRHGRWGITVRNTCQSSPGEVRHASLARTRGSLVASRVRSSSIPSRALSDERRLVAIEGRARTATRKCTSPPSILDDKPGANGVAAAHVDEFAVAVRLEARVAAWARTWPVPPSLLRPLAPSRGRGAETPLVVVAARGAGQRFVGQSSGTFGSTPTAFISRLSARKSSRWAFRDVVTS